VEQWKNGTITRLRKQSRSVLEEGEHVRNNNKFLNTYWCETITITYRCSRQTNWSREQIGIANISVSRKTEEGEHVGWWCWASASARTAYDQRRRRTLGNKPNDQKGRSDGWKTAAAAMQRKRCAAVCVSGLREGIRWKGFTHVLLCVRFLLLFLWN